VVSAQPSFSVTVTNTNDPPIFTSTPITSATEDELYEYAIAAADADAGTTLTFTGQTVPTWLSLIDNGDGTAVLAGTPANEDVGDHPVLIVVGDGVDTTPQGFTITVSNTNDQPRFVSPPVTGAFQGQAYSYSIVAADDDEGDTLTLTAPQLPVWLTLTDNGDGTGTLSGTPTNANVGPNPVDLRVTDAIGAFDAQPFEITVRNTNDAPTAMSDVYSVEEGGALFATAGGEPGGVLDNDLDPDGDAMSATLTSGVSHGALQFDVDGSFVYQHDGSETTSDEFSYIANDGIFVSNTATVQIQVIPVNDPPEITSTPPQSASQDVEYVYTVTTVDPDGQSVVLTAVTLPSWLMFADNGDGSGVLSGTPGNADVGVHQVVIRASDGDRFLDQSFGIDVGNTNDPPAFTTVPILAATQDVLYTYAVAAEDPDGDDILFALTQGPGWIVLADNGDGTALLSGTPTPGDVGPHDIILTVSDGVEADQQVFTITVRDVNHPPVFTSQPVTDANQDTPYEYRIMVEDADGDAVSISGVTVPDWLDLTDNGDGTGVLAGTPTPVDLGEHEVVLAAGDGIAETEQRFTITVDDGNDAPIARNDDYPLDEGGRLDGVAGRVPRGILDNDLDTDGDDLSAILVTDVSHGTLTLLENGSFSYVHDGSETTADQFTYRATDGIDESNEATVSFRIIPVNDAPFAAPDVLSVEEDTPTDLPLLANDEDSEGDVLIINSVTVPGHGSVSIVDDTIAVYTPALDFTGEDSFKYTVADDEGAVSDTALVTITVNAVNDAPVASDDFATTGESAPVIIRVLDNDVDPDGDALSISKVGEPGNGTAEYGTVEGTLSYTPRAGFLGEDQFSYTVSDGNGGEDLGTVRITVTALRFSVEQTGTLGGRASRAFAINDEGLVVGTSISSTGVVKAFLWTGTEIRDVDTDDSRQSQAFGVNDVGQVVGAVEQDGEIAAATWRVSPDKTESTLLPALAGAFSAAYDINNAGDVVGTSLGARGFEPVVWSDGSLSKISVDGMSAGQVEAINDAGLLAGLMVEPGGQESAIRGVQDQVGRIGTEDTRAYALNELGVAVGSKEVSEQVRAARWASDGVEQVLTGSGSAFAEAYGINDSGWIVGTFVPSTAEGKTGQVDLRSNDVLFSARADAGMEIRFDLGPADDGTLAKTLGSSMRAALWIGESLLDLNALVPAESGWTLIEARDVNNRGQIVGYGTFEGEPRAFILTLSGNAAPKAANDRITAFAGETVALNVLLNDRDVDGDSLEIIAHTKPAHGEVVVESGGLVWYTPTDGFIGEDRFTYTVTDGTGGSARAEVAVTVEETPERFVLNQNYPNPFNPTTTISYTLPKEARVRLTIFDALGRIATTLVDEERPRGHHEVVFDGRGLSSGVYFYRLVADDFVDVKRMVILK
jgi:probable HAF family extracellular repeat protein/VCBS repeat-containing protein